MFVPGLSYKLSCRANSAIPYVLPYDGIGKDEWWKERSQGPDLVRGLPPYKFAITYPLMKSGPNRHDINDNVGRPGTGLVTRLKQPIDRPAWSQAQTMMASHQRQNRY